MGWMLAVAATAGGILTEAHGWKDVLWAGVGCLAFSDLLKVLDKRGPHDPT